MREEDIKYINELESRVQELENENRILRTVAESNKYIGEQYLEQNKRYREALRKIIKEGENGEYSHYTAQRALEEKTDE